MKNQQNQNPNDDRQTNRQSGADPSTNRSQQQEGAGAQRDDRGDDLETDNAVRGGSTNPNSRREPSDTDAMRTERGRMGDERAGDGHGSTSTGSDGTKGQRSR